MRSLPRFRELVERVKIKSTQTFCLIKASENREVLCPLLLLFITLGTNLITGATSVNEMTPRAPVCSLMLLYDRLDVGSTKSYFNLRTFHATLFMRCLLQSKQFFRCFAESQSWTHKTTNSGRKSGSRVLFCSFISQFSFLILSFPDESQRDTV